jgi:hypothetical protein
MTERESAQPEPGAMLMIDFHVISPGVAATMGDFEGIVFSLGSSRRPLGR